MTVIWTCTQMYLDKIIMLLGKSMTVDVYVYEGA